MLLLGMEGGSCDAQLLGGTKDLYQFPFPFITRFQISLKGEILKLMAELRQWTWN